jgi:benzoate 4-monooxygenase
MKIILSLTLFGHTVTNVLIPFYLVEPTLFNTRNADIHQRKWKYMNVAFSPKNLKDFEQHMNPSIVQLSQFLYRCVAESSSLDFCRWCK